MEERVNIPAPVLERSGDGGVKVLPADGIAGLRV